MTILERNKLVLDNLQLAKYWAQKSSLNFDDATQICCVALIEATEYWDPDRGDFGVIAGYFCRKNLHFAILGNTIRQPHIKKYRTENTFQSLDTPITEDGSTLAEVLPDTTEDNSIFWNDLERLLSDKELKVCRMYSEGYSFSEISHILKIRRLDMYRMKSKIFEKLKRANEIEVMYC
ncbi:MAG: hypothetical protein GX640_01915 [Fibrobacter sp.]|nr:hypothetical protein [Fibrobacter sp.]